MFRLCLTIIFCCVCTLILAPSPQAFAQSLFRSAETTITGVTSGEVVATTEESLTLRLDSDGRVVEFKAPPAPNSTPLNPQSDPATMGLISIAKQGDLINLSWASRRGQRIPTSFTRLTPDAVMDQNNEPVRLDAQIMAPEILTERGGYFDLLETPDSQLIVYDRINNAVSGERDLYRMYADGRLPLCLTCFINPRPRAVLGNPAWIGDGEHVIFQMANDNADSSDSNSLAWGINHDLWALNLNDRALTQLFAAPPNHGSAHPLARGTAISFSERTPPEGDAEFGLTRLRNPEADGWTLRRATFQPNRLIDPLTSPGQNRRMISYPGQPPIAARTAAEDGDIDGIYARGTDPRVWEQLVIGRSTTGNRQVERKDLLGPALYDRRRQLLVYSSSRAIDTRALSRTPSQNSSDLFIRIIGDTTYQITDHTTRSRATGDIYQILDLDWDRNRSLLLVAVAARNPITGRERETEIWRYDLSALTTWHQDNKRPSN